MKCTLALLVLSSVGITILSQCTSNRNEKSLPVNESADYKLFEGGIVVYEAEGHGLVVAANDVGKFEWINAVTACDELTLNGYDDWRLPTREELNAIYTNLKLKGVAKFESGSYWSSSEYNNYYAWRQNFNTGRTDRRGNKSKQQFVRAVRSF